MKVSYDPRYNVAYIRFREETVVVRPYSFPLVLGKVNFFQQHISTDLKE